MNKRILFCIESKASADIDYKYINATIEHFYKDEQSITRRKEYLNSKTRYNDSAVQKKIKEFNKYSNGNSHIVYCIDVDDYSTSPERKDLLDRIIEFCRNNGYDLILFCRDIEEVYWGKRVQDNEKKAMSIRFVNTKRIISVSELKLRKTGFERKSSNILNVLDKYFTRR